MAESEAMGMTIDLLTILLLGELTRLPVGMQWRISVLERAKIGSEGAYEEVIAKAGRVFQAGRQDFIITAKAWLVRTIWAIVDAGFACLASRGMHPMRR